CTPAVDEGARRSARADARGHGVSGIQCGGSAGDGANGRERSAERVQAPGGDPRDGYGERYNTARDFGTYCARCGTSGRLRCPPECNSIGRDKVPRPSNGTVAAGAGGGFLFVSRCRGGRCRTAFTDDARSVSVRPEEFLAAGGVAPRAD